LGGSGIVYFGAHKNDFTVGHSSVYTFPDARADKISDFAVDAVMASGSGSIKATLMKGSPYAYFVFTGGNPRIDFPVLLQCLRGFRQPMPWRYNKRCKLRAFCSVWLKMAGNWNRYDNLHTSGGKKLFFNCGFT